MRNLLTVVFAAALLVLASSGAGAIVCGDVNLDGVGPDIADLTALVTHMFGEGWPILYPPVTDCNGDGSLDIADLVCWVDYMFQQGPDPNCAFGPVGEWETLQSWCLEDWPGGTPGKESGSMRVVVLGDDVLVYHDSAYYNCGLGYSVDWAAIDYDLTGVEADTGEPADCYCHFNLTSVIYDLDDGEYTITLIGLEGDTVGSETIVIGGEPSMASYGHGECVEVKDGTKDAITFTQHGDTLTMEHWDAFLNCGVEMFIGFQKDGDTLRFYELNLSWACPLPCMCYYDLWGNAIDIPPGTYTAEVYLQEHPWLDVELIHRRTLVVH